MTGTPKDPSKERIAKRMARAGLCSRREAERWIEAGRVAVNGAVIDSPALTVGDEDAIVVDGNPVGGAEKTRLWAYHKPEGLVTSHSDDQGRKTVFDVIRAESPEVPRVISVGRLDLNTEGLLLLTNDGEFARQLELPQNALERVYRVRAHGVLNVAKVERLEKGVEYEGVQYQPCEIEVKNPQEDGKKGNHWLRMTLREGKNREVRNLMRAAGLEVNRLIRTQYGEISLENLQKGGIKELDARRLRDKMDSLKQD